MLDDGEQAQKFANGFAQDRYGAPAQLENTEPIALYPLSPDSRDHSQATEYAWTALVKRSTAPTVRIGILRTPSGWYGYEVEKIVE